MIAQVNFGRIVATTDLVPMSGQGVLSVSDHFKVSGKLIENMGVDERNWTQQFYFHRNCDSDDRLSLAVGAASLEQVASNSAVLSTGVIVRCPTARFALPFEDHPVQPKPPVDKTDFK
jgi:hypothetical protein